MAESRYVTVFRLLTPVCSPYEPDLYVSVLRANGIDAYLEGGTVGSLFPYPGMGKQSIRVKVPAEDAERAVVILRGHPETAVDLPEAVYEEDEPDGDEASLEEEGPQSLAAETIPELCPNCGSNRIDPYRQSMLVCVLTTILLLGLPLIAYWLNGEPPSQWTCQDCDWRWTP